jgi:branched-chain amino acid transport system substrate-binding protein
VAEGETREGDLFMKKILYFIILISILISVPRIGSTQPILKVGGLVPFSGRWGDSGREYAKGILDASKWLNQRGGIFGRKVEVVLIDDQSQASETMAAFRKLNEADRILLLYVFSLDTALSLVPHIHYHRIPTLFGSLPSSLVNSTQFPYVFSVLPTPRDLGKIAMKFISENPGTKAKKPRVIFMGYPDSLSRDALDEIKKYGNDLGLDAKIDISVSDPSTPEGIASALTTLSSYSPDIVFFSGTSREAFSLLQGATQRGSKARWIFSGKAFDESLASFDGILGVQPVSPFGENVPGMEDLKEAHQRWHPYDTHTVFYVEGWATIQIAAEALGRSLPEQRLSRERVKTSLEGFKDFVTGGLVPPVTITSHDHRASVESRIFTVKDGKIVRQSGFVSVER